MRSFSLNDPDAYDIVCRPRAPGDRWPRGPAPVQVMSLTDAYDGRRLEGDVEAEAEVAFAEWQARLGAERIDSLTPP